MTHLKKLLQNNNITNFILSLLTSYIDILRNYVQISREIFMHLGKNCLQNTSK